MQYIIAHIVVYRLERFAGCDTINYDVVTAIIKLGKRKLKVRMKVKYDENCNYNGKLLLKLHLKKIVHDKVKNRN